MPELLTPLSIPLSATVTTIPLPSRPFHPGTALFIFAESFKSSALIIPAPTVFVGKKCGAVSNHSISPFSASHLNPSEVTERVANLPLCELTLISEL